MSDSLVVVQAIAAAVSALTAVYLVRATVARDHEARAERERDLRNEQLRRLVDGLRSFREMLANTDALEYDFEVARAEIAAAIALRPAPLPKADALLDDDVPKPPYGFGGPGPWNLLEAALDEIRLYARSLRVAD